MVEGDKGVAELVESSIAVERMYYVSTMEHAVPDSHRHVAEQISVKDMGRISQMNTAPRLLAVASIPERAPEEVVRAVEGSPMAHGLIACRLQVPNLGTLIRPQTVWIRRSVHHRGHGRSVECQNRSSLHGFHLSDSVVEAPMDFAPACGHFHLEMQERRIQPSRGRAVGYGRFRVAWLRGSTFPHPFLCTFRAFGSAESLNAGVASSIVCAEVARVKTGA